MTQVITALSTLEKDSECDVIIIARGGGSVDVLTDVFAKSIVIFLVALLVLEARRSRR